jgi:thiol-disulfide isomerase/thioredoxin
LLKKRPLDQEKRLPTGFGASIEVTGQALAGQGKRSEGVAFLQRELKAWRATSIRTRIQKNLNLLTLEGTAAPGIEQKEWIGAAKPFALTGKPVALFFWAHWCGDCKQQGPVLARLQKEFKRLAVVMPTQRYGYAQGGEEVPPAEEVKYIAKIREQFYPDLMKAPAPLSEETFKVFGCSTTPTLVLVDAKGIVRLYHPGKMTYEELLPKIKALVGGAS